MPSNVRRWRFHGLFVLLATFLLAVSAHPGYAQFVLDDGGDPGEGGNGGGCTLPGYTQNLQVTTNKCEKVNLTWNVTSEATDYRVLRDGDFLATVYTNSYSDTSPLSGTHEYRVIPHNSCGDGTASLGKNGSWVSRVSPIYLSATKGTLCVVHLTWPSNSAATTYRIRRNGAEIANVSTTQYDDTGGTQGTHYWYTITGVNDCGDGDESGGDDGWTTPPAAAIANLTASNNGAAINFAWTGGAGATKYYFYREDVKILEFNGPTNSFSYVEEDCGNYDYGIRTFNCQNGNRLDILDYPAPGGSGTPTAPTLAGPINASLQCSRVVHLTWTAAGCHTSFDVEVAKNSSFSPVDTTMHTTELFGDFNGVAATTYWWRVRRNTPGGSSVYTTARTFSLPSVPLLDGVPPDLVRTINGQVKTPGYVYWGETGLMTLSPRPTVCPCTYHWTLTNGQPANYTTSWAGNQVWAYNDIIANNLDLIYDVDITNGVGTSTYTLAFDLRAQMRPEDPGCPYVAVWTGVEYLDDNNLLPASEFTPGDADVTDFYRLTYPPVAVDGEYRLKLREFEHHRSSIDEVRLLAVDHPIGTEIAVDAVGGITAYERIERLKDARRATGESFAGLDSPFGEGIRLRPGDAVEFSSLVATAPGDELAVEVIGSSLMKESRTGEIAGRAPGMKESFAMRQRTAGGLVPLASAPTGSFDLSPEQPMQLNAVNLVRKVAFTGAPAELPLLSARHDRDGDALGLLSRAGGGRASLSPGESIELRFAATEVPAGMTRSFVLESHGRYRPVEEALPTETVVAGVSSYFRVAAAARGRLQLDYSLERDARITIDLVDVRGRIVQKMVSGPAAAGAHTAVWDGGTLASGVYFARMTRQEAGQALQQEVRKFAFIR